MAALCRSAIIVLSVSLSVAMATTCNGLQKVCRLQMAELFNSSLSVVIRQNHCYFWYAAMIYNTRHIRGFTEGAYFFHCDKITLSQKYWLRQTPQCHYRGHFLSMFWDIVFRIRITLRFFKTIPTDSTTVFYFNILSYYSENLSLYFELVSILRKFLCLLR